MKEDVLIDLESRIAFQEHNLQQLNDLVATQQKQLYDLEEFCKLLLNKVNAMPAPASSNVGEEKPPHY
jgi:SlyX protein